MTELYDDIGRGYHNHRQPDPRIQAAIDAALAGCTSILNVGAGAGSYEPKGQVIALEPSLEMIRQRPEGSAPVLRGSACELPFDDDSFDATMTVLSMHHWPDWRAGAREMRRVATKRVVILTFDTSVENFWLTRDYVPAIAELDRAIFPPIEDLAEILGGAELRPVPIPQDCVDGFLGAFWKRPEAYLDPAVRGAMSTFTKIDGVEEAMARLHADLDSGEWRRRNADILELDEIDLGYRLVVGAPFS